MTDHRVPRVVLIAGETSGDRLGGDLASALRRRCGDIELAGIAGPAMRNAGVDAWFDLDALNVMGLAEVIRHLPRLFRLRRDLRRRILAWQPDAVVGIDAPDFNLRLCRQLRRKGIRTVQYVAPTVWAWRPGRAAGVARSVDLLLALYPFEAAWFKDFDLPVRFVGHPVADRLAQPPDRAVARERLGASAGDTLIAILPGSRPGEIERHGGLLVRAMEQLLAQRPGARAAVLLADERHAGPMRALAASSPHSRAMSVHVAQTEIGLRAADCALVASGTATLEAFFLECPMTVFYRLAPMTHALLRGLRLVRSPYIALPNILSGREIVPEFVQNRATAANLAASTLAWLDDAERRQRYRDKAADVREKLARGAADRAAEAVLEWAGYDV